MSQSLERKIINIRADLVDLDNRQEAIKINWEMSKKEIDKLYGALQITDKENFKHLVENKEVFYC